MEARGSGDLSHAVVALQTLSLRLYCPAPPINNVRHEEPGILLLALMSLNPASYLQTWEHNLAAAHHRYRGLYEENDSVDGDDDEVYHDLPESSSSSASFLSRFSQSSLGRRLNFYPYAGAGVTTLDVSSLEDIDGLDGQLNIDGQEEVFGYKTIAAFDVSRGKRIGRSTSCTLRHTLNSCSAGVCRGSLLLSFGRDYIWICSTQGHPRQRRRVQMLD